MGNTEADVTLDDMRLYVDLCRLVEGGATTFGVVEEAVRPINGGKCRDLAQFAGKLEGVVGYGTSLELLRRRPRLSLTEAGRGLWRRYQEVLDRVGRAHREARETLPSAVRRGPVRIGTTSTIAGWILPRVIAAAGCWGAGERESIGELQVTEVHWSNWSRHLEEMDFLVVPDLDRPMRGEREVLRSLRRVMLIPQDGPRDAPATGPVARRFYWVGTGGEEVRPEHLEQVTVIHLPGQMYPQGVTLGDWLPTLSAGTRRVQLDHLLLIREWVARGAGVGFCVDMPAAVVREDAGRVRWADAGERLGSVELCLYSQAGRDIPEPASLFREALRRYCRDEWDR